MMVAPEKQPSMMPLRRDEPGHRHLWEITAARDLFVLLLLVLLLWTVYALRQVFMPVFVAVVLAHVFNPCVTSLERKWSVPRPVTSAAIVAVVFLALVGFFAWLGPLLFQQFAELAARLPEYLRTLAAAYGFEPGEILDDIEKSLRGLQIDPQEILGHIFRTTGRAVGILAFIFTTTTYLLVAAVLTVFFFFFSSWHFNDALARLRNYIPESRKERALSIFRRMDTAVGDFFRGRLLISAIVGILLSAGWSVIGVPYGFFLGMLTGVFNIVPFLSTLTWPVAVLLTYMESLSADPPQSFDLMRVVVWPSLAFIFVQLLDNWVLTPWIQSGQTDLGAATILLVVFIGGAVAGVWGLLFAIPIAACIKILLDEVVLPILRNWAATH